MNVFRITIPAELLVAARDEEEARKLAMAHLDWEINEDWLDADDTGEVDNGDDDIIR